MDEQPDESVKVRAELQHVLQKDQIKHIKKLKLWCARRFSALHLHLALPHRVLVSFCAKTSHSIALRCSCSCRDDALDSLPGAASSPAAAASSAAASAAGSGANVNSDDDDDILLHANRNRRKHEPRVVEDDEDDEDEDEDDDNEAAAEDD
jgi:hypothetical protein